MTLSERLRRVLAERSTSLQEVAERAGMSKQQVQQIVGGSNPRPNIEIVEKLAAAIGITMAELYADPE